MSKLPVIFFLAKSEGAISITDNRIEFWTPFGQRFFASKLLKSLTGGQGFEPRLMEPESIVLPLDDPPTITHCKFQIENFKLKNINTKFQVNKFGVRRERRSAFRSEFKILIRNSSYHQKVR